MRARIAAGLLLLGLVIAAVLGAQWWDRVVVGPGPLPASATVVLPKGAGLSEIAERLEAAGMVRDRRLFWLAAWTLWHGRDLKAGEYAVPAHASLRDLVLLLASGRVFVRRLTIPEGLTVRRVLAAVAAAEGLEGPVPDGVREGDLLPATYNYVWGDDRARMVDRMRTAMAETAERLWRQRAPGLPLGTVAEALTLASIVEKETGRAEERARVAGVFLNRLRRGMRLQSDPTVIYALAEGGDLGRPLTRADLRVAHPYNTYAVAGLPPGPIANPGRASIEAVLKPEATEDLYFVADGSGGHVFARTLDEHNRNVARWRQLLRERGQPVPAPAEE